MGRAGNSNVLGPAAHDVMQATVRRVVPAEFSGWQPDGRSSGFAPEGRAAFHGRALIMLVEGIWLKT